MEQKVCSLSSYFWWPAHVSDTSTRSSAHNSCIIIEWPMQTSNLDSRWSSISAIYFLNNKPLATPPPWFTPRALCIRKLTHLRFFTLHDVLLYKLRSTSVTFPCQPDFIILYNKMFRFTRSKALEKSTKHTTREFPMTIYLSTKHCKTNILSAVLLPWRNTPLSSSILPNASLTKLRRWYIATSKIFSIMGRMVIPC